MFTRQAVAFVALSLVFSSTGCCCLGGSWWGNNRCAPCNNGCAPGGSYYAPQGGAVYQQGAMLQGLDATQSAYLLSPTVPATALAPLQPLPTFH